MNRNGFLRMNLLLAVIILAQGLGNSAAVAKRETASGPIVRPIAWFYRECPLESFGTMIFTAVEPEATVTISAETLQNGSACGDPESGENPEVTHYLHNFHVMTRMVYDANLVSYRAMADGDQCIENSGDTIDRFEPAGIPQGHFVLHEDFDTYLNGGWSFDGAIFTGSSLEFYHDPGVGDWSTAELELTGLTPGVEYAVTFVSSSNLPCNADEFYLIKMKVVVDTEPGILRVAADGSGDYLTIGSALDVAVPGETLLVSPGTYPEDGLVLIPGVSIVGDTGVASDVVIQAQGSNPILTCATPTIQSRLANLTFRDAQVTALDLGNGPMEIENCRFLNNNDVGEGGAIYTGGGPGTSLLLVDCEFDGNSSGSNGGAIRSIGSDLEVIDCVFRNNSAGVRGGAIDVEADAAYFTRCVFENNYAGEWGGGLHSRFTTTFDAIDCTWEDNIARYLGGGAYIQHDALTGFTMDGCNFTRNQADDYGACNIIINQALNITGTSFVQNTSNFGSALSGATSYNLQSCSFVDNTVATAVIENFGPATLSASNTIVAFNNGPFLSGPTITSFTCNNLFDNTGGNYVGVLAPYAGVNGNLQVDPLFCDWPAGNIGLGLDSPCLADNNAGGCDMGSEPAGCAGESSLLTEVVDVPNDQGRQVRLTWLGSLHDTGLTPTVTGYAVYRRIDQAKGGEKLAGWDYLTTVPARGDETYETVVPTLCDSTVTGGLCWSTFMVSALTADPQTYYDSPPDSGYSVDNLSPVAPGGLQADFAHDSVALSWNANPGPDIHHYNVYRHTSGFCDQTAGPPVAQVSSTSWTDTDVGGLFYDRCYSVTAVDVNGNEGPATVWSEAGVSDVPGAVGAFALRPGVPNPFNPRTTLSFTLQESGTVALEIFDTRGRKVRTLVQGHVGEGSHEMDWFGRDDSGRQVSSGVYLVRLSQDNQVSLQRVTLLK